jgi:hypothetical protein
LLAWALTGDHTKEDYVLPLTEPATLPCFARFSDYPALVHHEPSVIDGFLLRPRTQSQCRKVEDFESESYEGSPATDRPASIKKTECFGVDSSNNENKSKDCGWVGHFYCGTATKCSVPGNSS